MFFCEKKYNKRDGKMNETVRNRAVRRLLDGDVTLVLADESGETVFAEKGIAALLRLAGEGRSLSGVFTADAVVGKAAAMLMVYMGATDVYADTVSAPARDFLRRSGVRVTCRCQTAFIRNRKGDGTCPMEKLVLAETDPQKAYRLLREKTAV